MLKQILYTLILMLYFIDSTVYSQDVQFSQLFADRLYLNPAYAGMDYCPRFTLSHRNQWPGVQFPYLTYSASFDKYIESLEGGLGIRIMEDNQGGGTFNQFSADLIYSYKARFTQNTTLNLALEISLYQKSQNTRDLVFYNMIDPLQGSIYPNTEFIDQEKFSTIDFSLGSLFFYKKNFFGLVISHIPQNMVPNHNDYLPFKITAHMGSIIQLDRNDTKQNKFIIEPNIVFIKQQGFNLIYYGTYFDVNNSSFSLFYRQNLKFHLDAMIASYHIRMNKFEIGYSYDITLSKFYGHSLGSHELSLAYILACDKKIRKYNTISCPSF